eukprot:12342229-Alexandrium_andersonii.AAC.1
MAAPTQGPIARQTALTLWPGPNGLEQSACGLRDSFRSRATSHSESTAETEGTLNCQQLPCLLAARVGTTFKGICWEG